MGTAFAVLMTVGAVGAMALPPTAAALIGAVGWRSAFASLGAMVLAIGLPLGFHVQEASSAPRSPDRIEAGLIGAGRVALRIFWIIVTVLFCTSIGQNGAIAHLSVVESR